MERHRCKICYRKFANGRALGGHMRSHMLNLPVPPPRPDPGLCCETESWTEFPQLPSTSSSSSESDDDDEEEEEEEELGVENNTNGGDGSSSVSDDDDNNSGGNNPTTTKKKRSQRRSSKEDRDNFKQNPRKKPTIQAETTSSMHDHDDFLDPTKITITEAETTSSTSPASSVSEVTSEEDVALCLMMLSRDHTNWKSSSASKPLHKFTCLTCHKVFKSYQALGGHRASHKKIRPDAHEPKPVPDPKKPEHATAHECLVCFRVFASAQALGGHKRTHSANARGGASSSNAGVKESSGPKKKKMMVMNGHGFIDLNLPAPVDDDDHDDHEDDDDQISQVSLSAVSNYPHFA